ncbi:tripartite motif-containing protein 2-like [Ptychodera flava]|uniref:tripartite motif-containing protein 2-like n=1 Tax=Ptychodera flava TaxID=63121 RepID=UPI00396A1654
METVKSLENCYQAEEVKIKLHIQKTIDDVTRMIRENGDKLLQELKDEYNKRKVNLNAQLKELECLESDMSYAREYAEKLMHYGNAAQLMSAKKGISSQKEELLRVETKFDPTETDYMEFKTYDDFCQAKTLGVLCNDLAERCTLVDVPEHVRVDENISITLDTGTTRKLCGLEVRAVVVKPDKSQENITVTDNNNVDPFSSVLSDDGSIITTDVNGRQVIVHDESGNVSRCFGKGVIEFPYGIAINPVNGKVYIADYSGHCIHIYSRDLEFCKKFGCHGKGEGQLHYPTDIAIDAERKVFVSDQDNHRIQVFDAEGQYLYSFGSEGSGDNQMRHPKGIALDCDDNVYVCDCGNNRVMKYESDGKFVCRIDSEDNKADDPRGICVTDDKPFGKVVVVSGKGCVQVFSQ